MENRTLSNYLGGGFWQLNKEMVKAFGLEESLWLTNLYDHRARLEKGGIIGEDDFFFLSKESIREKTGISITKQTETISFFESLGILEIVRKGNPRRNFYKINAVQMIEKIEEINQKKEQKNDAKDGLQSVQLNRLVGRIEPTSRPDSTDYINKKEIKEKENNENVFSKEKTRLTDVSPSSFSETPEIKPYKKLLFDPFEKYSKEAKEIFLYWNGKGKPLSEHKPSPSSITFKATMRKIEEKLKDGYTVPEIKRAINNYCDLLSRPDFRYSIYSPGITKKLKDFLEFDRIMLDGILSRDKNFPVVSWLEECVKDRSELFEKFCREVPDKHPVITEALKKIWSKESRRTKFTFEEENIFRKTANKLYNYAGELKDFVETFDLKKSAPATLAKFVIEAFLEHGGDIDKPVPYWLYSDNHFQDVASVLRDRRYIVDGYDAGRKLEKAMKEIGGRNGNSQAQYC